MSSNSNHSTYGFRLKGEHQERIAGLHLIGKEHRKEHTYIWDGLKRGESDRIVFQYTLSGRGAIRIGDTTYSLTKDEAFFVQIPSDHCYYLPEDSTDWTFIYITLFGQEALHYFNIITNKHGNILKLPIHARPIKHIFRLLEKVETSGINHAYEASGYAYSFLMECMQYVEHEQDQKEKLPVAIAKAITFIDKSYTEDLTLDDIVAVSGLSKYHFSRLFGQIMKETPIHYLAKIRIHHAIELLQHSNFSIEEIANKVGYTNGNYFSKVFKKLVDVTPSEYRNSQLFMPVDRLFID